MDTVKLDKRGKILITAYERKKHGFFPGEKFQICVKNDEIILKPYNYVCHECGEEIKEGSRSDYCKKCGEKYIHHVY